MKNLSQIKAMTTGEYHICAIVSTADNPGAVDCWGDNSFGQLGDGTQVESHVPKLVDGF